MQFTYAAYRALIAQLRARGYAFCDYHSYAQHPRCVILRHDIDFDLSQAVRLAELEAEEGVRSTYFVLLRTDFYNPASAAGQDALHRILSLGHTLGLHFDEVAYAHALTAEQTCAAIRKEADVLAALLDTPVTAVSMHRPSKTTLDADLHIPGMVNAYGRTFFRGFKYLSDSRCRWREPVEDVVRSGAYDRLHILTHPFWYHETDKPIGESVAAFIRAANAGRYAQMADNITDLPSILLKEVL